MKGIIWTRARSVSSTTKELESSQVLGGALHAFPSLKHEGYFFELPTVNKMMAIRSLVVAMFKWSDDENVLLTNSKIACGPFPTGQKR